MVLAHKWTYKTIENNRFWVVCQDCGTTDLTFDSEDKAKYRVNQLKYGLINRKTGKSSSLARMFPKRHW